MKFGLEIQVIENIISVLEQHPKVDKAFVFGSRAKGNYRPDSDIDIAIKGNEITTDDIIAISVAIETKGITHKFDLLDYHSIKEPALKEHIDRVGIELYSNWKEFKLEDIATIQTGPFGSQLHMSDYKISGTPIITVEHLGENKILHNNLPLVSNEDKQRLIKYTLNEGDIVFSRVGSVDRRAYVSDEEDGWMFSGRLLRVRVNKDKVCPKFLSFYFGQESFKETIRRIAVGATMPSINTTILSEIEVVIPQKKEQTAIASILSSLDDKIDLLHRQKRTLEQLAETLFRQWFVEEAEESWEVGKLNDLAVFSNGKTRPNEVENGGIPIYGGNGILGFTNQSNYEGLSIIIGRVGAYCGSLYIENKPIWLTDNALIARGKKEDYTFYLFYLLKSLELNSMAEGSSHPLLTQTLLKSIDISIPPSQKVLNFNEQVSVFWNNIFANQTQIRTLTQTRDTLLPKLMSGEVRVEM